MNALKILLLEDSPLDAELIQAILTDGGIVFEMMRVDTRAMFLQALETQSFDLILSDYSLPAFDGISALKIAQDLCPEVPFIFVSATLGEELAIDMLKSGATDYVLKQRLGRLIPSVQRALRETQQRLERQRAEAELHERTAQLAITNRELEKEVMERRRAEMELARSLEREQVARTAAENANRIKDEFLAILSHELRTPLNPIMGWARLLRTCKFDEEKTAAALETIERNARLQTQLVNDLLDISRILQGKLSLNICPVDLVHVLELAVQTVQLAAEAKSIQLQFRVVTDQSHSEAISIAEPASYQVSDANPDGAGYSLPLQSQFIVLGDADRLQQIVWNLLSNAVKFTPEGGRVDVELRKLNQIPIQPNYQDKAEGTIAHLVDSPVPVFAQLTVKDTGKGINSAFLPYVFDYFRQADSTSTRAHGGLGLGLAIVRYLVELHGGTIAVESLGEGQGATFTVRLPLAKAQAETATLPNAPSDATNFT